MKQPPDTLFVGSSELAGLMRSTEWGRTPVGEPEQWPPSVQAIVRLMLTSRYAMWMGWGPDLTFFYNDAYAEMSLGKKHPWALGKPASQVWAEIWDAIGPRIDHVLATKEFAAHRRVVGPNCGSDHYPVEAELRYTAGTDSAN